jgi:hypothetical protein
MGLALRKLEGSALRNLPDLEENKQPFQSITIYLRYFIKSVHNSDTRETCYFGKCFLSSQWESLRPGTVSLGATYPQGKYG